MILNDKIEKIKDNYQKEGFVIINNVFPKKNIKLVKKNYLIFYEEKKQV